MMDHKRRADRIREMFPNLGRAASIELALQLGVTEPLRADEIIENVGNPKDGNKLTEHDFYLLCRHCFAPPPNRDGNEN
jgi:hypothetical protein